MNFKSRKRARLHAIQALYKKSFHKNILVKDIYNYLYEEYSYKHKVEWDFFKKILSGVIDNEVSIKKKIYRYIKSRYNVNLVDECVLKLGTYEIMYLDYVPNNVIISEYISQANNIGTKLGHKLVNAVLDKISKSDNKKK